MSALRNSHPTLESSPDKSARILDLRIIMYLDRFIKRQGKTNEDTLEAAVWLLVPNTVEEDLLPLIQLLDSGRGSRRDRAVEEEIHDARTFSHLVELAMKRGYSADAASIVASIRKLFRKRTKQLRYSGKSEIEKNLYRFQKMFGLSEVEVELAPFFTIPRIYEEAESLFDYSLHCDRYSGRNSVKTVLDCSYREFTCALSGRLARVVVLESHPHRTTKVRIKSDFIHLLLGRDESELEIANFRKTSSAHALAKEAVLEILLCLHTVKSRQWERHMAIMSSVYAASANPNPAVLIDDCDEPLGHRSRKRRPTIPKRG